MVCTDVPSLRYLERDGLIRIGRSEDGFAAAVEELLQVPEKGREARLQCAAENTWSTRAKKMEASIEDFLLEKGFSLSPTPLS